MTALDHYLTVGAIEGRAGSPFFDAEWYLATYSEVTVTTDSSRQVDALRHYLTAGYARGFCPNPIFDEAWYKSSYEFDKTKYCCGYEHFLAEGAAAGNNPSPLFGELWYRQRYPEVAVAIETGLLTSGYHDYMRGVPAVERNPCSYFDAAWYRSKYYPNRRCGGFVYCEFLQRGAAEGRDPGPYFEELWYRTTYEDVGLAVRNGQVRSGYHHYTYKGGKCNYRPNPYFMPDWYLSWYPDAQKRVASGEFEHAYEHYLRAGIHQEFSPNLYFDETWYLHSHPDLRAAALTGEIRSGHDHYRFKGAREGRHACTLFDGQWYLQNYPEVGADIASGLADNPYDHFCRYGMRLLLNCSPDFDEKWYLKEHPEVAHDIAAGKWVSGLHHFVVEGLSAGFAPSSSVAEDYAERNVTADFCAKLELKDFLKKNRELRLETTRDPLISIILVLYNRAELTLRCLRSIHKWLDVPYELLIVDNDSRDETGAVLERIVGATVIRNKSNVHFLQAANQGANVSRGKYLLFLNNDSELQINAISSALQLLRDCPDVGAVGAKIILNHGLLQEAGSFLLPNGFSEQFGRGQQPFSSEYMHRRDVPYVSGAFLITARALFRELGGFDPALHPAYCEDADYCLKLWSRCLRVVFNPDSVIIHHESGSSKYIRFLYPAVLRNVATMRCRYPDYFRRDMPAHGAAPVAVLDGKQLRPAQLLIVDQISRLDLAALVPLVHGQLQRKFFLSIYPLRSWDGNRSELQGLGLEEVELVAGRGNKELPEFGRKRRSVYQDVIVLADNEQASLPCSLREIFAQSRVFSAKR
jgi:GT2 family glycosyltransferase